jgi:hypothetical protein
MKSLYCAVRERRLGPYSRCLQCGALLADEKIVSNNLGTGGFSFPRLICRHSAFPGLAKTIS